jgi:hypothetical protein
MLENYSTFFVLNSTINEKNIYKCCYFGPIKSFTMQCIVKSFTIQPLDKLWPDVIKHLKRNLRQCCVTADKILFIYAGLDVNYTISFIKSDLPKSRSCKTFFEYIYSLFSVS